ncbi:flavin reductase family protein [Thauera sinica]|uniref:Flavin reductase family protein n=1 Tax=Thauera sinica TaxID=2665146 RepID=A0ABW1AX77_9RHOO|nr:flavin reductase family protein [Thauera sp. K11]
MNGPPPVDAAAFKNGMRRLAGAVCILTVRKGGMRAGLTATAVMSVSAQPPRLMVCMNRGVFAHDLLEVGGPLCVNVLGADSLGDARRFAGMVDGVIGDERFRRGAWRDGEAGAPVLDDALAAFECRVVEMIPASSHTMVLCEVVGLRTPGADEAAGRSGQPLVYFDGRFASIGEL